jgi:hypothetical protein
MLVAAAWSSVIPRKGDGVHDDSASAHDLAALRAAVLRHHDEFLRMEPKPRSLRVARRLNRLHLSWLLIPWYLVVAARFFLPAFRGGFPDGEQEAVRLYRRLSGKDPQVARAEVSRIGMQLGMLDERLRELDEQRPGTPRGAGPGELEMATSTLVGFYLAGRRTDDELLAQVEVAWADYEELTQQQLERAVDRKRLGRGRGEPMVDERVQAAADRYRAAWRRWLDRQAERGAAAGPGAR